MIGTILCTIFLRAESYVLTAGYPSHRIS